MSNAPSDGPAPGAAIIEAGERYQVAQAIYNAVTAKTEKLTQRFSVDCVIHAHDFDQLEAKCAQACTQWQVLKSSTNVAVHHIDDNSQQFSSYERFRLYDKSRTAPVESVVYERDMLMRLPNLEMPQHYKVTVRVMSRAALVTRMRRELGPPPFENLLRFFGGASIIVEITYVDYVIARNMLSTIDSWVREVERAPTWAWAVRLHPYTIWIRRAIVLALVLIAVITAAVITPDILKPRSSAADLARWLIIAGSGIWLAGIAAERFGRMIERALDDIAPVSAILLNKGDERLQANDEQKNRNRAIRAAVGVFFSIGQGVVTKSLSLAIARWLMDKVGP